MSADTFERGPGTGWVPGTGYHLSKAPDAQPEPATTPTAPADSTLAAPVAPTQPSAFFCPNCTRHISLLLPCEPLYSLEDTAILLLTNVSALVALIGRHKAVLSPPLYRSVRRRRMRFLTATDVRVLRSILYSELRYGSWRKEPRSGVAK